MTGDAGSIGLIAGQGRLPMLVADGMRREGLRVCAVGLSQQYEDDLLPMCASFKKVGVFRVAQWARVLRRMGAEQAVMVGRVDKARLMHGPFRYFRAVPDLPTLRMWYGRLRHDHRSPAVLAAIADILSDHGITLIDSTTHIPEQMASAGTMTTREPSDQCRRDIAFGWSVLQGSISLGVGQAIAVREGDVIAVEAVEGTDRMIQRAGELCRRGGWTLLKTCAADHDRRADVPTIGEQTVRTAADAGCACIAVGAGDVIIVDKPQTLALADELGVAVVGLTAGDAG